MPDEEAADLGPVLESGMCIACGACAAADSRLKLELDPTTLMYQPDGPGGQAAASVCPAIKVDFEALQERLFPGAPVGEHGVVHAKILSAPMHRGCFALGVLCALCG